MRFRRFITAFWPIILALLVLTAALMYARSRQVSPTVVELSRGVKKGNYCGSIV